MGLAGLGKYITDPSQCQCNCIMCEGENQINVTRMSGQSIKLRIENFDLQILN